MSVSAGLAAAAAANSTAAAALAARAHREACSAVMNSYDPKGASVEQMRTYASCVQESYRVVDPNTRAFEKVAVGSLMAFFVIGFVVGYWRYGYDQISDGVFGGICGAVMWLLCCALLAGGVFLLS